MMPLAVVKGETSEMFSSNRMSVRSGICSKRSARADIHRRLRSAQLEEHLVRKRQAEFERLNFWNNNSTYFKTWEFNTNLYSNLESNAEGIDKLQKQEKLKKTLESLQCRRAKLRKLLESEDKCFAEEIEKKKKKPILLEDLNAANVELLLREEEARRRERDLKMHHYWRQNQPCLRDFESKQHADYVKKSWLQQVIEKRKEKETEEMKMIEHLKELKRMQEEHDSKEKELREEKKKTELELKNFLDKQIELVKCKEEREKILKSEELEVCKLQNDLEKMLEERRQLEERRKRKDLSLFHKKQFQLLLRRRANEIKENLEADKKFLDNIANEEKYELAMNPIRVEQYKRNLEFAREICKKQAEIEKLRTSQAQYLFDEEAKKVYEKQEAEWQMESEARQKLMDDVLQTLQLQLKEKLVENLKEQEETQFFKEQFLKSVEKANKELEEYQEKAKQSLDSWKKDLDQQILEKKLELYYKKKQQEEDKENELKAKKEEEERLCKELTKMYLSEYQPKSARRKKFLPL